MVYLAALLTVNFHASLEPLDTIPVLSRDMSAHLLGLRKSATFFLKAYSLPRAELFALSRLHSLHFIHSIYFFF